MVAEHTQPLRTTMIRKRAGEVLGQGRNPDEISIRRHSCRLDFVLGQDETIVLPDEKRKIFMNGNVPIVLLFLCAPCAFVFLFHLIPICGQSESCISGQQVAYFPMQKLRATQRNQTTVVRRTRWNRRTKRLIANFPWRTMYKRNVSDL